MNKPKSTKPTKPTPVGGSCSVCGGGATSDYFIFRAGIVDGDGEFFSRACGDAYGNGGCLSSLQEEQKKLQEGKYEGHDFGAKKRQAAGILLDLMPGEEDDGVVTMMEDMGDD